MNVQATDELASLVQAFNEMTQALETNARELRAADALSKQFLNNIPSGVVSITADGRIRMTNRALGHILPQSRLQGAETLDQLFPPEEASELRYLMNRARRTRVAAQQLELETDGQKRNLSITVSALEDKSNSGFVVVIEDTSDILRAQKAAAWREVAQRIATNEKPAHPHHPVCRKNCPPGGSRISARRASPAGHRQGSQECSATITQEVESVRNLVDEFWRFSRFPAANPSAAILNEVVEGALAVSRAAGWNRTNQAARRWPSPRYIDREQFKRVIVNLIDNSAEAMKDAPAKQLLITTRAAGSDAVELEVADTGCGVQWPTKRNSFYLIFPPKAAEPAWGWLS